MIDVTGILFGLSVFLVVAAVIQGVAYAVIAIQKDNDREPIKRYDMVMLFWYVALWGLSWGCALFAVVFEAGRL